MPASVGEQVLQLYAPVIFMCEYLWGAYTGRSQGEPAKFRQTIQGSGGIQVPSSKHVPRVCLANPSCGAEQT